MPLFDQLAERKARMAGNPWEAHADEESLERYAMGLLREEEAAPLEEHLLLCAGCRNRLTELDQFLQALRNPVSGPIPVPGKSSRQKAAPSGGEWAKRPAE